MPQDDKFAKICTEFIETERSYVEGLESLMSAYYFPLLPSQVVPTKYKTVGSFIPIPRLQPFPILLKNMGWCYLVTVGTFVKFTSIFSPSSARSFVFSIFLWTSIGYWRRGACSGIFEPHPTFVQVHRILCGIWRSYWITTTVGTWTQGVSLHWMSDDRDHLGTPSLVSRKWGGAASCILPYHASPETSSLQIALDRDVEMLHSRERSLGPASGAQRGKWHDRHPCKQQ